MTRRAADFALFDGRIRTDRGDDVQALAAHEGRIVAVGTTRDMSDLVGPDTRVLNAEGRRVIPGLIDAHLHFVPGGLRMRRLELSGIGGRAEFVERLALFVRRHPHGAWIQGGGWSNDAWADPSLPHRDWIDAATPRRPVFLWRMDCHAALVNSAALALAGIDRHGPPDPPGGVIDRDAATREPTGILRDTAMQLVLRHVPPPSESEREEAIRAACRHANSLGLTMVHNMLDWQDWPAMQRMRESGGLSLRVYNILHQRPDRAGIERWRAMQPGDDLMRCGACKNYMDGSLGSRTAWMLEPYAEAGGSPAPRGLRIDGAEGDDALLAEFVAADRAGLQLCAHAIGDAANRQLLNLYEAVVRRNGPHDHRLRVEHAQHVDDADIGRFSAIGAIASMQPLHKYEDGGFADRALGTRRGRTSYRFGDLLRSGATLAFGSDWPIVSLNPFEGMHAAVTGCVRGGGTWLTEQNLTIDQALAAYTVGAAYAAFMEDRLGRILPGYYADVVVLSDDLLAYDADAMGVIRPIATVVSGEVVWRVDE